MGIFAWLMWLMWVFSIFDGFTFADWQDFAPLATLALGLAGGIAIACSPRKPASPALILTMCGLALWPLLPHFGLYFLAREFGHLYHGAWPQVMVDDPKGYLGHASPRFDALFHLVNYLEAFAGAYLVLFFTLFALLRSRFSRRCQWLFIAICVDCALISFFDPGNLYAWWLD